MTATSKFFTVLYLGLCLFWITACDEFTPQQTPKLSVDTIDTVTSNDGELAFRFKVSLNHPSNQPISFDLAAGISETQDDIDYDLVSTEVTLAPGELSQTILVSVVHYEWDKSSQYFVLAIDKPKMVEMDRGVFFTKIKFPQKILTAIEKAEQSTTYLLAAQARYTKLDDAGQPVSASTQVWDCVRDNNTGLIWEVKTEDKTLRDKNNTFSWFDTTGTPNNGKCTGDINCDTQSYIRALNTLNQGKGLCGITEWRLPSLEELESIVDKTRQHPAINTAYFPYTNYGGYWSSTESKSSIETNAWHIMFSDGRQYIHYKNFGDYIRLVHKPVQTSSYKQEFPQVFLRGTFNKWDVSPMVLVGDNLWELKIEFEGTATDRFKFDIYGNWKTNFGDFTNDGQADSDGTDIAITEGAGIYQIRFNDKSMTYTITKE